MENQDKLYELFKSASEKSETKDFSGLDKVWGRVEDKLDSVVIKKSAQVWKKLAIAASILLIISVGYQFLKADKIVLTNAHPIVLKEKVTAKTLEAVAIVENKKTVTPEKNATFNYDKIDEVLTEPTQARNSVSFVEQSPKKTDELDAPVDKKSESQEESKVFQNQNALNVASSNQGSLYPRNRKFELNLVQKTAQLVVEYKNDANKEVVQEKKLEPLYVADGVVLKADKAKKLQKILDKKDGNNDDSEFEKVIELKEPLYIINGTYYSEQELFGPNPTSVYSPLNKQDIDSISILQSDVATPIYGEKGKNGVVVITTKYGKPIKK